MAAKREKPTRRKPVPSALPIRTVLTGLRRDYPDACCSLDYRNALELLVATVLSAQCTDERVNLVTKELFRRYRSANDYATSPEGELEELIRSTGFFNNKAKSLRGMGRVVVEKFGGEIPGTMEELLTLPGVARKTANVVLGNAFQIASGITVDTHVFRLSRRMGLSREKTPEKVEQKLMELVPRKDWILFGHAMIQHGRAVCKARKPDCELCRFRKSCPKD
ncbi:MAG: endonuclease III [Planctomycetota bacterium]